MKKILFSIVAAATLSAGFYACKTNSITGRKQLSLVSSSEMMTAAAAEYKSYIDTSKVIRTGTQAEMVKRIGTNIANAVTRYYTQQGKASVLDGYKWEYNLVNSNQVNAWCMPGGKIVVYTGILPVTQNEDALAVVMGHEIAHAIAEHGKERASQAMLQQVGGAVVGVAVANKNAQTQNAIMNIYGLGSNVGFMLPYSRNNELEADELGLAYAAMAGYNPEAAIPLWQRMAALGGGTSEFLSTHPAEATRIKRLQNLMPNAITIYKQAKGIK